jgi:hypothetical protein
VPTRHRAAAKKPARDRPPRSGQADARSPESAAALPSIIGGRPVSARDLVALAERLAVARLMAAAVKARGKNVTVPPTILGRQPEGRTHAQKATVSPRRELQAAGRRGRPPKYHPTEVVELVDDWKAGARRSQAAGRAQRSGIAQRYKPAIKLRSVSGVD